MSLSTKQPVGYPSIRHLASIIKEKATESVLLNPLAKKPLTREDREKLNFPDVHIFVRHVESSLREVYDSVMRLRKYLILVDKQNQKLKSKFTNYEKANKAYFIDNAQLKTKNNNLENWLADLEKQLENAWLDKHSALSPLLPPLVVTNNSDDNSKQSKKTKSTQLPGPPMITDGHTTRFNINVWESKMVKKLNANADHYPLEALCMAYVDSHVNREAYKHLAIRSRIDAQKPFAIAEEIFKILQKTYGNINWAHTAMNKFRDLKITKNFNSFWTEFQVLVSKLDYNESTLICELKLKLTPSLSQAMAGNVSRPKNIHKYAK